MRQNAIAPEGSDSSDEIEEDGKKQGSTKRYVKTPKVPGKQNQQVYRDN